MAGHSQFKNIMHKKGAADARRSKVFGKLAREITIDMHSHAGRFLRERGGFEPVAGPMRAGGMNLVCLAMVALSVSILFLARYKHWI